MYNFVPSLSWFGFGSRNQGENHNKQLFELHLWQQQIMQAVDSVPTLTGCCIQGDPARILARYQACHVTHQLGISSLNLLLIDPSEIRIQNLILWLVINPQIHGGNFMLVLNVTWQAWYRAKIQARQLGPAGSGAAKPKKSQHDFANFDHPHMALLSLWCVGTLLLHRLVFVCVVSYTQSHIRHIYNFQQLPLQSKL